jgi:hypothetical protein
MAEYAAMTIFGLAPKKSEGARIPYDAPLPPVPMGEQMAFYAWLRARMVRLKLKGKYHGWGCHFCRWNWKNERR